MNWLKKLFAFVAFERREASLELVYRADPGNPDWPGDEPGYYVIVTPPGDRDMKRALFRVRERDGSVREDLLFPPTPELLETHYD